MFWAVLDCGGLYLGALDCTWLYWAVVGCTGLYWTVLVFTRLNWAVVGCSRLNCGVLGCTGRSQQLFVCVFSHFRHGDERTTEQPGDPSASLLLTSVRRQSFAITDVFGCLQYLFVKVMLICSKTQCLSYLEKRYQFVYMKENCLFVKDMLICL